MVEAENHQDTMRIVVTGGSGFIGTSLVQNLLDRGAVVLSLDMADPQNPEHQGAFQRVDILDRDLLLQAIGEFRPTHIVHLAAKADLHHMRESDVAVNTVGARNVMDAAKETGTVERMILASTKLVCRAGHKPKHETDYSADTLYGRSKVEMERMIRGYGDAGCEWCIARPTSIWGPWYGTDYTRFFIAVAKGLYVHPGRCDPPKSFGYVGNTVHQIRRILDADAGLVNEQVLYLSDYAEYTIRQWAEAISMSTRGKLPITIPSSVMIAMAKCGDLLMKLGWKRAPMNSFRLNNMWSDTTGFWIEKTEQITGTLPYTMSQGVDETLVWLAQQGLLPTRAVDNLKRAGKLEGQ